MRVIGGEFKGRNVHIPKNLPVRPTTDFAREGLFNVLNNQLDFNELTVLDLFSGTGLISLEFLSRGVKSILSIDIHPNCLKHIRNLANEFDVNWLAQKRDVFNFLKNTDLQFDLIFADPPYDLKNINEITPLVFQNTNLLHPDGVLIVEHSKRTELSKHINFVDSMKYGNGNFSVFKHKNHE